MPSARPEVRATASLFRTVSRFAPVAGLVIATLFTVGFAANASAPATVDTSGRAVTASQRQDLAESRRQSVSRSSQRLAEQVTLRAVPSGYKFATAPLNVWTEPGEQGKRLGLLASGSKVAVTGQQTGHWAQVLLGDRHRLVRWVNADYLAQHRPRPARSDSTGAAVNTGGISTAPCPDGSSTESGLTSSAVLLFRAVCNAFPQLTTYGGYSPHGEHADGHAIDFMISHPGTGQAVADWVRANAAALHVYDVIWEQHIWTPERASEGWRYMPDRGSPTANHMDHVHVSVY